MKYRKSFKRFPGISELAKVKEFTPSKGSVIFFQSTPNSYHGVSLFREIKGKKRFFIYGSYALSKPVVWRYKNVSYLPKIKKTNNATSTWKYYSMGNHWNYDFPIASGLSSPHSILNVGWCIGWDFPQQTGSLRSPVWLKGCDSEKYARTRERPTRKTGRPHRKYTGFFWFPDFPHFWFLFDSFIAFLGPGRCPIGFPEAVGWSLGHELGLGGSVWADIWSG